ncbi:hypothetical protein [Nonlabens sp. Asnod3-A02]|uniref:hypothetical protein n=1 Tax=Nonlabens sp. Asnod3-A02 TaxID=3160579 RepID=UPI00386BB0AD
MTKYLLIVAFALMGCKSKSVEQTEVIFTGQQFKMELLKGKWLTNGKKNKSDFRIFREDFKMQDSDLSILIPYELKKDSIFFFINKKIISGRLVSMDTKELKILWGNSEPITYYRPK